MKFGTVLVCFDALCPKYKNNNKIWYTVNNSTERAFQYMDKHGQTSIGMPILGIRCFSQESIQRIF